MFKVLVSVVMFLLFNIATLSQGKIISKEKADELFGQVLVSIQIPSTELNAFATQSSDVLMFKILNNELYILDNKRKTLKPLGVTVNSTDTFSVYSVEIVKKLLIDGNSTITYIEKRNEVLTMTNGIFTLEYSADCPPFCTD
ncbi:MAG: hypothetical protein IPM56_03130 [Ignavibacteriales bacterium]|nr:MAG: hypothetical protein IPM56_03130 [Ignavibacteriales bacterium]